MIKKKSFLNSAFARIPDDDNNNDDDDDDDDDDEVGLYVPRCRVDILGTT